MHALQYAHRALVQNREFECLEHMIFFGRTSLENAVQAYFEHCHAGRNHQRLGNKLSESALNAGPVAGRIASRERLGGMLKYDQRRVA